MLQLRGRGRESVTRIIKLPPVWWLSFSLRAAMALISASSSSSLSEPEFKYQDVEGRYKLGAHNRDLLKENVIHNSQYARSSAYVTI